MNINTGRVKELIEIISELNEERQKKLVKYATKLRFEQGQEDLMKKSGNEVKEEDLERKTHERIKRVADLMEKLEGMDKEHLAAVGMFLNERTSGEFAKEEEIQIKVDSRYLGIEEYLNKYIPGVDIEKTKSIMKETKDNL